MKTKKKPQSPPPALSLAEQRRLPACPQFQMRIAALRPRHPFECERRVRAAWFAWECPEILNADRVLADPWPRSAANERAAFLWLNRVRLDAMRLVEQIRSGPQLAELGERFECACAELSLAGDAIVGDPQKTVFAALSRRGINAGPDAMSAGSMAIAAALVFFDPTIGARFSTYCYTSIHRAVHRDATDDQSLDDMNLTRSVASADLPHCDRDDAADAVAVAIPHMPRSQAIIVERMFGVGSCAGLPPEPAIAIAMSLNISKQRVYQLRDQAFSAIRRRSC